MVPIDGADIAFDRWTLTDCLANRPQTISVSLNATSKLRSAVAAVKSFIAPSQLALQVA